MAGRTEVYDEELGRYIETSTTDVAHILKCKQCKAVHRVDYVHEHKATISAKTAMVLTREDAYYRNGQRVNMREEGYCPTCGRFCESNAIKGILNESHKCDARCTGATGHNCECSCGGKNHGADHRAA